MIIRGDDAAAVKYRLLCPVIHFLKEGVQKRQGRSLLVKLPPSLWALPSL